MPASRDASLEAVRDCALFCFSLAGSRPLSEMAVTDLRDVRGKECRRRAGTLFDALAGMARVGAVIAPVDAVLRPTGPGFSHSLPARGV